MLLVIGITGLASSGKGEFADYLVKKYGFTKLVFSDVLKEEAEKRNLLKNKNYEEQKNIFSKLGEKLRKESGKWDILAEKLVEKIKSENFEKVVIDGFRSAEEVNLFKKNFENFYLVFIDVDEKIRFFRRKREDPTASIEDFRKRDKRDIEELGLGKVIEMIDFTIKNDKEGLENLQKEIDGLMKKIL
ncbi:MAG: AAA family ATPase [Candidatus Aenigmarchaeota archaeon]|nr:AAA family ATPase [Candidatus Aenigmarchaeota archaeon]